MTIRRPSAVALAALVYLIVASLIAAQFGTWTDEEYTLATTSHGPSYAYAQALGFELQAPLYFVLEAMWREANASLFWARLPSILCVVGLFFAFERIGRRLVPAVEPLPFVLLAVLNPFVVFAGFEIRLYALALVLSSIVWLLFDAGFVSGSSGRARIGFAVATVASVYVQYFLAFMLAGFALVLLVRGRREPMTTYAATCVPIVLAVVPLTLAARAQVHGYVTSQPASLSYLIHHTTLHPWLDFLFPYERDWDVSRYVRPLYEVAVACAAGAAIVARPRLSRAALAWVAGAAIVDIVYFAIVAMVRLPLDDRYYVALYVPLAVAYRAVIHEFASRARPQATALVALSAVLGIAVLVTDYRHLALPGDWRRVAAYLRASARPGDAIVVYAADAAAPLRRVYRGPVPIASFPTAPHEDVYSADLLTVHSQLQATRALAPFTRYRRVWFVSNVRCRADERSYGCAFVQPAIDRAFTIVDERGFYESRVEELLAIRPRRGGEPAQAQPHR